MEVRIMVKSSSSSDMQQTAGFLGGLVKQVRLAWRLFRDSRVPGWVKMIPFAGFLYLLSPIDLIPDWFLPGLGEVDDVVLLVLAMKMFIDLSPPGVVRDHLADLFGTKDRTGATSDTSGTDTIDGAYRVLDAGPANPEWLPVDPSRDRITT
jgi:uncharacterized membrane protein YkvA (DUF1232 family)